MYLLCKHLLASSGVLWHPLTPYYRCLRIFYIKVTSHSLSRTLHGCQEASGSATSDFPTSSSSCRPTIAICLVKNLKA